jgi:predicted MFS family arabinose efflux permease
VSMPIAAAVIHYAGSRPVMLTSAVVSAITLVLLTIPINPVLLAGTLFVFGAALGAMDVAMNSQAIVVQRAVGRPIMSGFHALFSVGGLLGATAISLLLRGGVDLRAAAIVIGAALVALAFSQHTQFLPDHGAAGGTTFTFVPSRHVMFLGALCFISFLAEGAVLDWSAVFLRELRHVDLSIAGIGYAAFSTTMIVGRLTGDRITHRLGARAMLRLGGVLAAIGFLTVALVPGTPSALAGFAIVGFGASNIVPVLFSAAGQVPGVPPGLGLATVTTIAYAGLLLGPALIGFVADATSLPFAFVTVAAMLVGVAASAGRVRHW